MTRRVDVPPSRFSARSGRSRRSTGLALASGALLAPALVSNLYSLALLGASARRGPSGSGGARDLRFTVLVPAHDEEQGLSGALTALQRMAYPRDMWDLVVVADNCTDDTAVVARAHGARVLERDVPEQRGKGQAIAWAIERLEADLRDVLVLVDADCVVSENLLSAFDRDMAAGADVVQADYRVGNPEASTGAALRYAAFLLHNTIRPLGRTRLRLSAGLLGTGMGIRRDVLQRVPWEAFGITEDREYHFRLVAAGIRVVFVPDASVRSDMPVSDAVAAAQQTRWEGEKGTLARQWAPRLARVGLRERDASKLEAALEAMMLPQAAVGMLSGAGLVVATASRSRGAVGLGLSSLSMQVAYVLGGMLIGRAPRSVWRALAGTPALLGARAAVFRDVLSGQGSKAWVRTAR